MHNRAWHEKIELIKKNRIVYMKSMNHIMTEPELDKSKSKWSKVGGRKFEFWSWRRSKFLSLTESQIDRLCGSAIHLYARVHDIHTSSNISTFYLTEYDPRLADKYKIIEDRFLVYDFMITPHKPETFTDSDFLI